MPEGFSLIDRVIPPPNPYLGQYLLDANALDSSDNDYNLTTTGSVSFSNVGGFDCAGPFSVGNYFSTPAALVTALNASNNWEIQCDVQFSNFGIFNTIIDVGYNDFFGSETGSGLMVWNDDNGPGGYFTGSTFLSLNTWYNVKFTWDGTTRKIYINGVLDGSSVSNGQTSGATCLIGEHAAVGLPLPGYLRNLTFKLL